MSEPTDVTPPLDPERTRLTEAQMDDIADRAATRALERVYANIGKGLISKIVWLAGAIGLAILAWLAGKGALPK